ncbi:MAG: GNAT family N-acetyltransferase [Desulfobacteraceae bacterium]|nr:GNAT family N-acetyltransferase [Desulfobacteraceae bacterium]
MEIILESDPGMEEINFLEQQLLQFNCAQINNYSYENFIIKAIDDSNSITAGIHGQIGGGWLYIASLWVRGDLRGQGAGKKLLSLAEERGIEKKCGGVYLYTYSFQSPGFYEKSGYEVFGTLEDFCGNHSKLYMKKRLALQNPQP